MPEQVDDPLIDALMRQDYQGVNDALASPRDTTEFNIKAPPDASTPSLEEILAPEVQRKVAERSVALKQSDVMLDTIDKAIGQLDVQFAPEPAANAWVRRFRTAMNNMNSDVLRAQAKYQLLNTLLERRAEVMQERRLALQLSEPEQKVLANRIEAWGKEQDEAGRAKLAAMIPGLKPGSLEYYTWVLKGELPKPKDVLGDIGKASEAGARMGGLPPEVAGVMTQPEQAAATASGKRAVSESARKAEGTGEKEPKISGLSPLQVDRAVQKNFDDLAKKAGAEGGFAMRQVRRVVYDENGYPREYQDEQPILPPDVETALRQQAVKISPEIEKFYRENRPGWFAGQTTQEEDALERARRVFRERTGGESTKPKPE